MSLSIDHKCLSTKQHFSIFMDSQKVDEEGLLKNMQISELVLKITKLTFGWNNHANPITNANELMNDVRKLSLEIAEYEQRMGSALGEYQRNIIYNSMEELENAIPYMKNKIKPAESLEIADQPDKSLV